MSDLSPQDQINQTFGLIHNQTQGPSVINKYLSYLMSKQAGKPQESGDITDEKFNPDLSVESANAAAAGRMRQAVQPAEGRQDSGLADAAFDMIPGRTAISALSDGNYKTAALDAALSFTPWKAYGAAARVAAKAAKPIGAGIVGASALLPTSNTDANAVDKPPSAFDFITDPAARKAAENYHAQIKERMVDPKTGRLVFDKVGTKAKQDAFLLGESNKVGARAAKDMEDQRTRDLAKTRMVDFDKSMAGTVGKLRPDQQAQYYGTVGNDDVSTMTNRSELLKQFAADADKAALAKTEAQKGFKEKWPELATGMQATATTLGAAIPAWGVVRRAMKLDKLSGVLEKATGAKVSKSSAFKTNLAANRLEGATGLGAMDKAELATAPALPFIAGSVVPNVTDAYRLADDPTNPAYKSAMRNLNPANGEFWKNLGIGGMEGIGATMAGHVLGSAAKNFPEAHANATATLKTVRDMQEAQAAQMAASKAAAATKAAAKAAAPPPAPLQVTVTPKPRARTKKKTED